MAEGVAVAISTKLKDQTVCSECKTNPWKYKCPGCSLRTCSLPCVKAHKHRTSCTGKRNQTQFVPMSQFDDNLLLSDFNLLEDAKRVAEAAQRARVKLCGYPRFRLPGHLKGLQNAAARRRTKLWFLSNGMLRRERNKSKYNQRSKSIYWTIEWRFHSTDVVLLDHGIHENRTLRSAIEKHLQPSPWGHKLRKFCDEKLENLKFFVRTYPKGPKSAYRELDIDMPISHLLSKLVILEYPAVHIFLPSHSYDFEVVRDLMPKPVEEEPKKREPDDQPSHSGGVHFREEEIEEGEVETFPDAQIIDLKENVELRLHERDANFETAENSDNRADIAQLLEGPDEPFELDLDEDFLETCSFLMDPSNPGEFLNFSMDLGEGQDFIPAEELEEGEIPSVE